MSDSNNPYGAQDSSQPPTDPYGQPPAGAYGQPPEYTAPQHGGPQPAGQQGYGQHDYGQTPYGQQSYGAKDPSKRPGTVLAASIVTMVITGLVGIVSLIATVGVFVARDDIVAEFRNDSNFDDVGISADDVATLLTVVFLVVVVWCVAAFVLAVLAMRGRNWARIMVVISAATSALVSLLAILSGVSALTLIGALVVIALYFVGGANQWYAHRSAGQSGAYPPDMGIPPSA